MSLYPILLGTHIAAGSVALVSYWTAGLMAKGTRVHRRVGQVYLWSMLGILLSGAGLTRLLIERGQSISAMFLGFLLLLTGRACWVAWRAIRDRRSPPRFFGPVYWLLTVLLVLAGVAMIGFGVKLGVPIFMVFGGVGTAVGLSSLGALRRARSDSAWWLKAHYGAMIGNGIATHIAFFGIGLRRVLPGVDPVLLQNLAWFVPLFVAAIAGWRLSAKYGRPRSRHENTTLQTRTLPSGA